ncbi:hypothetical protein HanRHA438_Chr13g0613831 [Helianthus annuus]|uniref:Uncharacterized protein n=1 Tax=Helianthus annuus TaxID=4232 RepID=A0A9K3HDM4_HELAN|nr:hypothetical protein HanXRQr2_Chr13g0603351 [Helianthus annuus]KAJ0850483.1 hypothetical protein HanPSC8_Chr13g0581371 [Helianthus annuus]KAJ0859539.1 hypothetical protein HanRHA438_Chr13g0613831 [Helianthus annuus]
MLEASARARAHARCAMRRAASWLTVVRRAASWLTAVRGAAVRLKSVHAACGGAAQVRPCGGAACATSPCESIRARHTVTPYWLTLVRRTRHSKTHAPCSEPRASCTRARMRMTATSCTASPTTWSLQPLCFTTRARSKIQRRLSSGSRRCERAKCKVRHQSATLRLIAHATRARASVCECELGCSAPFARTLVCASMKQ